MLLPARPPPVMEVTIAGCPNKMVLAAPLSEEDYWRQHHRPPKGWETLSDYDAKLHKIYNRYLKGFNARGARAVRRFMVQGKLKLRKQEQRMKLGQLKRLNQVRTEREVIGEKRRSNQETYR